MFGRRTFAQPGLKVTKQIQIPWQHSGRTDKIRLFRPRFPQAGQGEHPPPTGRHHNADGARPRLGACRANALGHRKYALGPGCQSATGQNQAALWQSCQKSQHDPENCLLGVFNMEKTAQKEG